MPELTKWVDILLSSTRIALFINGEPGDFFGVSRGFKQGDPLPPSLFAITKEVLSTNLKELVKNSRVKTHDLFF